MESVTLAVIRAVRTKLATADFPDIERGVIDKFLGILIDELEKTNGPTPTLPTKSRKVSGR
jgi:hypothetical protein